MKENRLNLKGIYPKSLLLPALLVYTFLFSLPTVMGFYYSLTNWNTFSDKIKFVGLQNFQYIFVNQPAKYLMPVGNTILFAVVTSVLEVVLGLGMAILLNRKLYSRNYLRAVFFIPQAVSPIVIGIMFVTILNPTGLFNNILGAIGLGFLKQDWLMNPHLAMPSVMGVEVWRYFGLNMVIFLAGLQAIDKSYYEAADMDGANNWQRFVNITIPYIMPAITINIVLNIIHGFRVFDTIFALTNGGPGNATEVIGTAVYREFSGGMYGIATALNVILMILTSIAAVIVHKITASREVEL